MSKPREFFADSGCYYITENDGTNEIEPEEMLLIEKYHADKLASALESIAAYHSHEPIIDEVFDVARQALRDFRGEK